MLPLDITTLLAIIAFTLIAWDASRIRKNPGVMLVGFGLLLAAVIVQLFSGGGFIPFLAGLFTDIGFGFLIASILLAIRKSRYGAFLALGIIALIIAGLLLSGQYLLRSQGGDNTDPKSILVELGPDDRIEEISAVIERYGLRKEQAFPTVSLAMDENLAQVYLLTGAREALERAVAELKLDEENVDDVSWNGIVRLDPPVSGKFVETERVALANDPLTSSQWALSVMHVHEAHQILREIQPVRKAIVAIIDTGVDGRHEDVSSVFGESPVSADQHGHGTHCAGIAGAVANNGVGMASLNWEGRFVEIRAFQALGNNGFGTHEMIAQAIIDAVMSDADVLSISLGDYSPNPPKVVSDALAFALKRGAIPVASAGNANRDARDHMPTNIKGVIAVAAIDQNLQKARFSNTVGGLERPIAAPGVDIVSLVPGNQYTPKSGTSMATPHVSGLIGVLRSLKPSLSAEEAFRIIHRTGTPVHDSDQVGNLINAEAAIRAVLEIV